MSRPVLVELLVGLAADEAARLLRRWAARLDGRDPEAERDALDSGVAELTNRLVALGEERLALARQRAADVRDLDRALEDLRRAVADAALARGRAAHLERELLQERRAGHQLVEKVREQHRADVGRLEGELADLRKKLLRAEVTCTQAARTATAVAAAHAYDPGED